MKNTLEFTTNLARETGQLLLDHFSLGGTPVNLKADRTVVTEADLAADKLIAEAIKKAAPKDTIISEESTPTSKTLSHVTWVIDPLDGTSNFSLGLHAWGVSIARLEDGLLESAALHFPVLGELYSAQRGQGAYLNGQPIKVKPPNKDQPTAFFTCCTRTHRRYKLKVPYKTRILGSAAYSFCTVARGAAVMGFQATPKIWDIAAGWLLVQEAGGVVGVVEGPSPFPLSPGINYEIISYPTLISSSQELHVKTRAQIQPHEHFVKAKKDI